MERHQFGFSFMRQDTGGQRVHSFWGTGKDVEECRKSAIESAKRYAYSYENELNEKARMKNRSNYAPPTLGFGLSVAPCGSKLKRNLVNRYTFVGWILPV